MILDVSHSPDTRAMQIRMSYQKQLIQVVCVYLPAGGTAAGLRPTLLCVAPLLLTRAYTTILGGDFEYNPGWNPFYPISPPSIVRAFQELVPPHMTAAVPKSSQPTWNSEQGFSGALDHILTTRQTCLVAVIVCMEAPFPSDHMPILAENKGLTHLPVPPAMSAKGKYLVPRFPEESELEKLQEHFDRRYQSTTTSSLDVDIQKFSTSMLSSVEATFGPPVDYVAIPRLVQNVLGTFRKYITQRPNWSHSAEETRKVAKLKARIRAAWDIVDVEHHLRVLPISALCVSGSPTPSKRHCKWVTQAAQTSRLELEPTYTAGDTTPTEL